MDDNVFEVQIRGDQFGDAPFIVQAANERLLIENWKSKTDYLPAYGSATGWPCFPERPK